MSAIEPELVAWFRRCADPDELAAFDAATDDAGRQAVMDAYDARMRREGDERRAREQQEADERHARNLRVERHERLIRGDFPPLTVRNVVGTVIKLPAREDADVWSRRDEYDVDPGPPLVETPALTHARAYVESDRRILVLCGAPGTGKSTAATWIADRVEARAPRFVKAQALARAGLYDRELSEQLDKARLLVVDDLGTEFLDAKGCFQTVIDEVVDSFYSSLRHLLITTNLDAKTFAARYGARIWSRVCEVGKVATCGATDLRRAQ